MLCSYAGDADLWRGYFNCLQRLTPEVPAALRAESQAIGDPARTGAAARPTLISLGECHDILEPAVVLSLTLAAMYLDLVEVCRTSAWRFVQEGRNGGPARPYARSLAHLGIDEFLHGNWREAQTLADEGASVCDEYDYMNGAWYFAYIHALLAAGRGNTGRARRLVAEIGSACAPRRSWGAQRFSHQPLTLAAVADGNWEEAYRWPAAQSAWRVRTLRSPGPLGRLRRCRGRAQDEDGDSRRTQARERDDRSESSTHIGSPGTAYGRSDGDGE